MQGMKALEVEGRGTDNEGSYLKKGGQATSATATEGDRSQRSKMKLPSSFSCLLLLSFGACFPPDDGWMPGRHPGKEFVATEEQPGLWGIAEPPKWRRSAEDLHSLFSIAKELQSFGKERAGIQFRFGRDREDENEAVNYLPEEVGMKRGDTLGSLAEELNGYSRKKGGFSFRFGRRVARI